MGVDVALYMYMRIFVTQGSGKTILVNQFARILGYSTEPVTLYQDMSSRDLFQQRTTLPSGDTGWKMQPLLLAAISGRLAILDGVHRLDTSTLTIIRR